MPTPRVLIVDGEPVTCHSLCRVGERQHLSVQSAGTAAEGLRLFESFRPDVVVLDLHLPEGTGLETFRHIRETDCRCPVIFITVQDITEIALAVMREGAFDYLTRPVDPQQLDRLLERAIEAAWLNRGGAGRRRSGRTPRLSLPSHAVEVQADRPLGTRGSECPHPASEQESLDLPQLIAHLQRDGERDLYQRVLRAVDRVLLSTVLGQTQHNQVRASAILGIDRKTLRQKLRSLGLVANPRSVT